MKPGTAMVALLVLVGACGAADVNPEPPGGGVTLNQLSGRWVFARRILRGKVLTDEPIHYRFEGNRYTYEGNNGKLVFGGSVKLDPKPKQPLLIMPIDNSVLVQRHAFKLENEELHLVHLRPGEWADFSGRRSMVIVLKREKK